MFHLPPFQIEASFIGLIISVVLRVTAAIIYIYVIKKALDEARNPDALHNGLAKLRKQLVFSCTTLFLINTLGLGLLVFRPFANPAAFKLATDALSVLNSIGFLLVAWIKLQMYTQQYTPEQKEIHRKIDLIEKGQASFRSISPKQQKKNKKNKTKGGVK